MSARSYCLLFSLLLLMQIQVVKMTESGNPPPVSDECEKKGPQDWRIESERNNEQCIKCSGELNILGDSQCLQQCQGGYFLEKRFGAGICQSCDFGCSQCTNIGDCQRCTDNHVLGDGKCKCKNNQIWDQGTCYTPTFSYKEFKDSSLLDCPVNCISCEDGKCIAADFGYKLNGDGVELLTQNDLATTEPSGKKIAECSNGNESKAAYQNQDGWQCAEWSKFYIQPIQVSGPDQLISELANIKCLEGAEKRNSFSCKGTCGDNKYYSIQNKGCQDQPQGCKYMNEEEGKCQICKDGYARVDGECKNIGEECLYYNVQNENNRSIVKCVGCMQGYMIFEDKCIKSCPGFTEKKEYILVKDYNPIGSYDKFNQNELKGLFQCIVKQQCKYLCSMKNQLNEKMIERNKELLYGECFGLIEYFKDGSILQKPIIPEKDQVEGCLKYQQQGQQYKCDLCERQLKVHENKCVEKVNGYYYDNSDKQFKPCHPSCQECTGPQNTNCSSCDERQNRVLNNNNKTCDCHDNSAENDNGICQDQGCSSNQYYDKTAKKCNQCDIKCKTCITKADKCLVCADLRIKNNQGECVCQQGYQLNDDTQLCESQCDDSSFIYLPQEFESETDEQEVEDYDPCIKCNTLIHNCLVCEKYNKITCKQCEEGYYYEKVDPASINDFFVDQSDYVIDKSKGCQSPQVSDVQAARDDCKKKSENNFYQMYPVFRQLKNYFCVDCPEHLFCDDFCTRSDNSNQPWCSKCPQVETIELKNSTQCASKCPDNQGPDVNKNYACQACSQNCQSCYFKKQKHASLNYMSICTKCDDTYVLINNQCVKKDENCHESSPLICDQCKDNFFLIQSKHTCVEDCPEKTFKGEISKYIRKVEGDDGKITTSVVDKINICQQCHIHCKSCTGQTNQDCTACIDGMEKVDEGNNKITCKCQNGYNENKQGICVVSCKAGYYQDDNGFCKFCLKKCKTCKFENKCETCGENREGDECNCKPGFIERGQICVQMCNGDTYYSNEKCESCSEKAEGCKSCKMENDKFYCTQCEAYYILLKATDEDADKEVQASCLKMDEDAIKEQGKTCELGQFPYLLYVKDQIQIDCRECPATLLAKECTAKFDENSKILIVPTKCQKNSDPVDDKCTIECDSGNAPNPENDFACEPCTEGCSDCYYMKYKSGYKQFCKTCADKHELSSYKECLKTCDLNKYLQVIENTSECKDCQTGCLECFQNKKDSNAPYCKKCAEGYALVDYKCIEEETQCGVKKTQYYDGMNLKCIDCKANCNICELKDVKNQQSMICTECDAEFTLVRGIVCTKNENQFVAQQTCNVNGCDKCDKEGKCIKCEQNFYFNSNKVCVEEATLVEELNCQNGHLYVDKEGVTQCADCVNKLGLNNCLQCQSRYLPKKDKFYVAKCLQCEDNFILDIASGQCGSSEIQCVDGQYQIEKKGFKVCQECPKDICPKCKPAEGGGMKYECLECADKNQIISANKMKCIDKCRKNQFLVDDVCQVCDPFCEECSSGTECSKCKKGYEPTDDKKCQQITCNVGFELNRETGECKCPLDTIEKKNKNENENENENEKDRKCTKSECNLGTYYNQENLKCENCSDFCDLCNGPDAKDCTQCIQGFYLTEQYTCLACPDDCLSCQSSSKCTSCKPGKFFYISKDKVEGSCLDECKVGYYPKITTISEFNKDILQKREAYKLAESLFSTPSLSLDDKVVVAVNKKGEAMYDYMLKNSGFSDNLHQYDAKDIVLMCSPCLQGCSECAYHLSLYTVQDTQEKYCMKECPENYKKVQKGELNFCEQIAEDEAYMKLQHKSQLKIANPIEGVSAQNIIQELLVEVKHQGIENAVITWNLSNAYFGNIQALKSDNELREALTEAELVVIQSEWNLNEQKNELLVITPSKLKDQLLYEITATVTGDSDKEISETILVLSTIVNKIQTLEDIGLSLTDFSITPSEGVAFSSEFTIVFDLTGATKEYERYGLTIKPADSASWELNNYLTNQDVAKMEYKFKTPLLAEDQDEMMLEVNFIVQGKNVSYQLKQFIKVVKGDGKIEYDIEKDQIYQNILEQQENSELNDIAIVTVNLQNESKKQEETAEKILEIIKKINDNFDTNELNPQQSNLIVSIAKNLSKILKKIESYQTLLLIVQKLGLQANTKDSYNQLKWIKKQLDKFDDLDQLAELTKLLEELSDKVLTNISQSQLDSEQSTIQVITEYLTVLSSYIQEGQLKESNLQIEPNQSQTRRILDEVTGDSNGTTNPQPGSKKTDTGSNVDKDKNYIKRNKNRVNIKLSKDISKCIMNSVYLQSKVENADNQNLIQELSKRKMELVSSIMSVILKDPQTGKEIECNEVIEIAQQITNSDDKRRILEEGSGQCISYNHMTNQLTEQSGCAFDKATYTCKCNSTGSYAIVLEASQEKGTTVDEEETEEETDDETDTKDSTDTEESEDSTNTGNDGTNPGTQSLYSIQLAVGLVLSIALL